MRILIATDAWAPQVNGVVNTLMANRGRLQQLGHEVLILSAEGMPTFSCPTYPEIRLACRPCRCHLRCCTWERCLNLQLSKLSMIGLV